MWVALLFYKQGLFSCTPPEIVKLQILMFTDQQIEQFKRIYTEEFGREITTAEALEYANLLITGFKKVSDIVSQKS